jgi:hypothetical protein
MNVTDRDFTEFAAEHNLGELIRFHNVVRGCLAEKATEYADDKIVKSSLDNYVQYLATVGFLMVYAYLEEYLCVMWRRIAPGAKKGRQLGIDKYEDGLKSCGFDLQMPCWQFILKASKIRHCLLHANGRLDFMVRPPRLALEEIVCEYPGELDVQLDRLSVKANFTSRFVTEVRAFRTALWEAIGGGEQS